MKNTQMIKNIYLNNDQETREIGFKLGKLLKPGSIVCLIGDLGAGKTTMTQSLAEALDHKSNFHNSEPIRRKNATISFRCIQNWM